MPFDKATDDGREARTMSKPSQARTELLRRALNNHKMVENSLFIKVKGSTLYDTEPGLAHILKDIAFAGGTGVKKPEGSPYDDYKQWCWATQATIALWSRYSERYVRKAIARFVADGVIETREWRDHGGHPRVEYRVIESVVEDAQRMGTEERKRKTNRTYKPNKGSFKKKSSTPSSASDDIFDDTPAELSAVSHRTSQPEPTGTVSQSHRNSHAFPTAETAVKGVVLVRDSGCDISSSSSPSPFGVPEELKPLASREEKSKGKTNGASGLKAETTPTPKSPKRPMQYFVDDDEPVSAPVVSTAKGFDIEDAD